MACVVPKALSAVFTEDKFQEPLGRPTYTRRFWGTKLVSENVHVGSKSPLGAGQQTNLGVPREVRDEHRKNIEKGNEVRMGRRHRRGPYLRI